MAGYRLIALCGLCLFLSFEAVAESGRLRWKELTDQQQRILEPLAEFWDGMEFARKKKWLSIAKRYPNMSPLEQQRIQSQMQGWYSLTAEQRKQARERFKKMEQLPPQKRQEIKQRWYEYEQLPSNSKKSSKSRFRLTANGLV
ncbi:DUF3106 domain-containing protein [Nitrosomonas sp.]|uniref:DUF3106 domain-containing protein n=1 Tax=Nitrosomonas sp. TaxID=42353 RepID=UPI001DAF2384|nr:DUF3106 domain-containing protein [Nitrosomonas sp.]MBX3615819.1 DUF3106 domain-containing protein [Nitrosomonas sp.]